MINEALKYLLANEQVKLALMDYYNRNIYKLIAPQRKYKIKSTDNWCAMFCSVIAHKCGVKNFPYEVSVFYMTGLAKKAGSFTRDIKEVKAGDLIVYDWKNNGTLDHVGIITEVTPNLIKVIEGNYKNTVGLRSVKYPNNEVYGFIKVDNRNGVDVEQLARDAIRGVYGTGEERKKALGVNYEAVQKRINEILK
jgi:hypothetical protein